MNELNEFLKVVAEGKKTLQEQRKKEDKILEAFQEQLGVIGKDPTAAIINEVVSIPEEIVEEVVVADPDVSIPSKEPEPIQEVSDVKEKNTLLDKAITQISKSVRVEEEFQQPIIPLTEKNLDAITKKIKFLENWLTKISSTGPGSGEVNFRYLDDVNRITMTPSNDNWVLEYDAATKKVQFTKDIGPIDTVQFDITHTDEGHGEGTLAWNAADRTLNLHHQNGVIQQVGQEQYYLVRNLTGSTILDGAVCMFAGAEAANASRLLAAPMLADGTYPSLYVMGVATQNIPNGEDGFVTSFGRVGGLNTTGSAENWQLGNILYASPTVPGGLTNVKPTAPNNVIPVAAVVKVDATDGQIFVRPTIEQRMFYGTFSDTTDQSPPVIETPYAITFNTTNISYGISLGTPTSRIVASESGYYNAVACLSLTSTNSSAKAFYVWARKNGVDIPFSARRQSVAGNGTYQILKFSIDVSLAAGDYIEVMYAASDTTISIESPPATAFCPAIPSATVTVNQIAL